MAANSKIEWCDCSYQVVTGCCKISPGCANCYAEKMAWRLAHNPILPPDTCEAYAQAVDLDNHGWSGVITPIPGAIERMYDELSRARKPRRVFVQSMGDLFHEGVPAPLIDELWWAMRNLGDREHIFMILTKRHQRLADYFARAKLLGFPFMRLPNIWLGVTVCTQAEADEKIPVLLNTPAAVRFVSVEPMLGPLKLPSRPIICAGCGKHYQNDGQACDCPAGWYQLKPLDWVICGAETGPGARHMDLAWARDLRDQCKAAGVPFFFKSAGRGIKIPEDLMIREFPKC